MSERANVSGRTMERQKKKRCKAKKADSPNPKGKEARERVFMRSA